LGQGCAGIDEIDTVFQGLQKAEVIDGHHCGDCSATSAQEHTFVAKCRPVDSISESVSLLITRWVSHDTPPQTALGQMDRLFDWHKLYSG
jgi:hypothetical protein